MSIEGNRLRMLDAVVDAITDRFEERKRNHWK
jgi:hypothetical protein